jgi:hypothetical protein
MIVHIWMIAAAGVALCLLAWWFEHRPKTWKKVERMFPLLAFHDSQEPPVGGPPKIEFGKRPRDPSDLMIQRGVDALRALEYIDPEELDNTDARVLVQMVWAQMWAAWSEETKLP